MRSGFIVRLPWPPSTNTYYRNVGHMTKISKGGREYRKKVMAAIWDMCGGKPEPLTGDLHVRVEMHPPDKRRRDVDNSFKGLLDSLTKAGIWDDDSQIKSLWGQMLEPCKPGSVLVTIEQMAEFD